MNDIVQNTTLLHFALSALAAAVITEVIKLGRGVPTSAFALRVVSVVSGVVFALLLDRTLFNLVLGIGSGGLSTYIFWAVKRWIKSRSSPQSSSLQEPRD
jgi:hypothetical protein